MTPELEFLLEMFDETVGIVRTEYAFAEVKPQPKQSFRYFTTKTGKVVPHKDPKKMKYVDDLIAYIKDSFKGAKLEGSIRVTLLYCFPWRKSDKDVEELRWALMNQRPDIDNCLKPLLDACNDICFKDDAQVVEVRARKIRFTQPCIALRFDEILENRSFCKSFFDSKL